MVNHLEALRIRKRLEALKQGGRHLKDSNLMSSAVRVIVVGKTKE